MNFTPPRILSTAMLVAAMGLGMSLHSGPASAATPAELLEKGIYAEETVGDLDEAIKVYESVVAEADASQRAAATAQLRIGLCLLKQGKSDEATAAFELVVQNYPSQPNVVAQAQQHLPKAIELAAVPWGEGDEYQLEMQLPNGMGIGLQVYRVAGGADQWTCNTWQLVTLNGQFNHSRVVADRDTFAPQSSIWKHSILGTAQSTYVDDMVSIQMLGRDEPNELKLDAPTYDNEQAAEVFRRLPLAVGYKTKLNIVAPLSVTKLALGLEVTKIETVEVPAGSFECFRLKLDIGQTFWISTDERRQLVRFEAGGISANLVNVIDKLTNEPTRVQQERFAVTLPQDWFAYTPSNAKTGKLTNTFLMDPVAKMKSRIESGPLETIIAEHDTPAKWLASSLQRNQSNTEDFEMADDAVQPFAIEGMSAASAQFTFTDGDKAMVGRHLTVYGKTSAVNFRFAMLAEDAPSMQATIDRIVRTVSVR